MHSARHTKFVEKFSVQFYQQNLSQICKLKLAVCNMWMNYLKNNSRKYLTSPKRNISLPWPCIQGQKYFHFLPLGLEFSHFLPTVSDHLWTDIFQQLFGIPFFGLERLRKIRCRPIWCNCQWNSLKINFY